MQTTNNPKLVSARLGVQGAQSELGAARAAFDDQLMKLKLRLASAYKRIAELEAENARLAVAVRANG